MTALHSGLPAPKAEREAPGDKPISDFRETKERCGYECGAHSAG